ncbi:MAG TPA: hypothetical protein VLK36_16430 [Gaiellaceae bacterium]|nr:hypothetical protein [Gaiellaceae bacterium]
MRTIGEFVIFLILAFIVWRLVVMGRRFHRGESEMESGGSMGDQMLGRRNRDSS